MANKLNKNRVLLFVPGLTLPPSPFINPFSQEIPGNLGVEYVASALRHKGAEVRIRVLGSSNDMLREVEEFSPQFVGFTSLTFQAPDVARAINQLKEKQPCVTVVIGGEHASISPNDFVENSKADFIIRGEGEKVVQRIFIDEGPNNQPKILQADSRLTSKELDDLLPTRTKGWGMGSLRPSLSSPDNLSGVKYPIITRRGCGHTCDFCSSPKIWGPIIRLRSEESLASELIYLAEHFPETGALIFCDLDFFIPISQAKMVVQLIKKLKDEKSIPSEWYFYALGSLSQDVLELLPTMSEIGFREVSFGIEDLSESRNLIKKGHGKACILVDVGNIVLRAFLMIGHPAQGKDYLTDFPELVKDVVDLFDNIRISIATPFPGTGLWETCQKENLFLIGFDPSNFQDRRRLTTDEQVVKAHGVDLNKIRLKAVENFYLNDVYLTGKRMCYPLVAKCRTDYARTISDILSQQTHG